VRQASSFTKTVIPYVEVGGRIQVQYLRVDPNTLGANSTDDLFLRRFYLETEATLTENWSGKFQMDFADDEVDIKDAYIVYEGFTIGGIYIGNQKVPFAREQLTSSRYQQLVERTFVGDNFRRERYSHNERRR
jgi:phosphate-selective porin OprO and OprP